MHEKLYHLLHRHFPDHFVNISQTDNYVVLTLRDSVGNIYDCTEIHSNRGYRAINRISDVSYDKWLAYTRKVIRGLEAEIRHISHPKRKEEEIPQMEDTGFKYYHHWELDLY